MTVRREQTSTRNVLPASQAEDAPAHRPPAHPSGLRRRGSTSATATATVAAILCGVGGLAALRPAHAQTAPAPAAAEPAASVGTLQEVVVTGTPEVSGVKLLNASFAVTTASLQQIHQAMPSSTADLFKIVPGLWAESSSGQTGANIEIAGFPGGGDAPYVTVQINGSPVYPAPTLSFMANSSLIRLDDTVERVEVVKGGPSAVYSNGQIGATANFILRHGTSTPHGELALTGGTEGLYRIDGFYGGPLSRHWDVSIGGFWRTSDGIRNSQFPSDRGGQLTGTLYRKFSDGSLLFWARDLNDKNQFITDIPVEVSPNGESVSAFPGFNPNTGTFAGDPSRVVTVQEFPCGVPGCIPGTISIDQANGRGSDVQMFGSDLKLAIGPWFLSNTLGYTTGRMPTNSLFNNLAPESMSAFIASEIATANGDPNVIAATGGARFTTGTASIVSSGAPVAATSQVASMGLWYVDKKIQAFTDDLRFSRELFLGNTATLGGYFADYSADDHWLLGNNLLMQARPNAQLINVTLSTGAGCPAASTPGGACTAAVTRNGVLGGSFFALNAHYTGRNAALYLSDQWRIARRWIVDAEYRAENQSIDGSIEQNTAMDLDANPLTLYNNGVSVANGQWTPVGYDHTLGFWSAGVNYELSSHMSVWARTNTGYHLPSFDDLRSGTPESQKVENYEVGYRVQTPYIYASLDGFHRLFFGVPFTAFLANGSQFIATYGARSWGVDFQADLRAPEAWIPLGRLSLAIQGDWQDSVYTHFFSPPGPDGTGGFDFNGSTLQRQPRLQYRLTPQYALPVHWGLLKVFATITHVDQRYSNPGNSEILPAYTTLDAGVVGDIGDHVEVRVQGSNLTNTIGLTEGNARVVPGQSGISTGFEMARPIFGREVQVRVKYVY